LSVFHKQDTILFYEQVAIRDDCATFDPFYSKNPDCFKKDLYIPPFFCYIFNKGDKS